MHACIRLSRLGPNPSLKVSPNGVAHWACGARPSAYFAPQSQRAKPGLAVRGTFSPARAWRPAVAARLARTLGRTETGRAATQQEVRLAAEA
jgi:hypothetical protein